MSSSMTGYGRSENQFNGFDVTVEIKSVNHRYFESNIKTPRGYSFLEEKVCSYLKERVARGKVEVYISLNETANNSLEMVVNTDFANEYVNALKQLAKRFKVKNDISVMRLAQNSDIVSFKKKSIDEEVITEAVLSVLADATDKFCDMRKTEGEKLKNDICSRADEIIKKVEFIEERTPQSVNAYRERLLQKIKDLLGDVKLDEQRIITETAIMADKVAVDEETVRLRSHIEQLKLLLNKDEPIGRKLDFIVQEMNREANTTGSKASDIEITNTVVDIKSEIEKIREQIQNIE